MAGWRGSLVLMTYVPGFWSANALNSIVLMPMLQTGISRLSEAAESEGTQRGERETRIDGDRSSWRGKKKGEMESGGLGPNVEITRQALARCSGSYLGGGFLLGSKWSLSM